MLVCVCVWGGGGGVGGGGGGCCLWVCLVGELFVGVSCVCVRTSVYVCICHPRDRKKIFLASKDKNKVLKS